MSTKTVKISESTYRGICQFAGELQKEMGRPVSVDKALSLLLSSRRLSDLAGAWVMGQSDTREFQKSLRKGWSSWKIRSV